ncbi:MAG: transposase, partial [Nanoarchaeota archaeon]|nr:transposase [Nanoarchaeota archaeon]
MAEACIRKMAYNHGLKIHILKVLPDHVHILVTLPRGMLDSKALMLLKGGSAYYFFKNHPKSRLRLPQGHLWSAGGCAVTVG